MYVSHRLPSLPPRYLTLKKKKGGFHFLIIPRSKTSFGGKSLITTTRVDILTPTPLAIELPSTKRQNAKPMHKKNRKGIYVRSPYNPFSLFSKHKFSSSIPETSRPHRFPPPIAVRAYRTPHGRHWAIRCIPRGWWWHRANFLALVSSEATAAATPDTTDER